MASFIYQGNNTESPDTPAKIQMAIPASRARAPFDINVKYRW